MPFGLAIGAIAAPVVGGIIGNEMSKGDRQRALALQEQALKQIMAVNTPDVESMKLGLEEYGLAGQINPEMTQAFSQGESEYNKVQTDPRLRNAQLLALSKMQQIGSGGLRPQDRAALGDLRAATAMDEQGRQQAILQNMQMRGLGGSGAELAARLASSQGAANRANASSLNIGAQANQAALQSILNSGQLGGQIQAQDFGQQAQKASAQDVINRYNTMNAQQVSGQNTNLRNAAQAQNLANKQNMMNQNTQVRNQQQMFNRNLPQLNYQNQLGKASAAAGALSNQAGVLNNQAAQTQQMFGGLGQAAGTGAMAGASIMNNNRYMDILNKKYNSPSIDPALD